MRVRPPYQVTFLVLLLALVLVPHADAAFEVPNAPGIWIVSPEEVLRDHVQKAEDGALWFTDPGGHAMPLVLSTEDPEIQNRGDGSFHPADLAEVRLAVEALPPSLIRDLHVQIFLLPYPRSGLLSSSADDHAVYLTPGVFEYTQAQVHFLVGHELGHSFHRAYLPDSRVEGWKRYRELRGITDPDRFRSVADHAYRPHEIFAEDFRVLFAGTLARGDGRVENREVAMPEAVPGLARFLAGLAGEATESVRWSAYPNPLHRGDQLRLRGGDLEVAEAILIDATGRRVATIPLRAGTVGEWRGQTSELDRLQSGAYWLRIGAPRRAVTVPLRWIR